MAYKLLEERITPGGLNLLVPSDQTARRGAAQDLIGTPQGDSLDLTDWWPAADGHLEQSPSYFQTNNPAVFGPQNSLCQAGTRTYYSDGSSLRQIGRAADAPFDTGYDGYPLGMLALQGYVWIINRAKQRKDDGTTVSDWTPLAPTGACGVTDSGVTTGTGPNGGDGAKLHAYEDSYRMTWVIPGLGETNPSVAVLLTPALDLSSTLIDQGAGTPPTGATGWNIYRQIPAYGGASLDANTAPYLLNTNGPIALGSTFVDTGNPIDNLDDTSLLRFGQILEADHDAAPAARIMANQSYNGRIVVANSAAHPNRIWWTPGLQPAFFRGSGDAYDGDWVDVGTDSGDEIRAMVVRPGMLVIYRAKSIWVNLGDMGDANAILQPVCPDIGVVGPRAVVSTGEGDYFIGPDGVYRFNNDWPTKLSTRVEPIFRGLPTENFSGMSAGMVRANSAIGHRNGRLWVSLGSSLGSLVCHLATGRWFSAALGYLAFLDTGTSFLGAGAGIFTVDSNYTNSGTLLAFQSQYHDAGLPDRQKTWGDLVITHNTQSATLTIICRTNKFKTSNDSFTLATFSSSTATTQIFPLVYPAGYAVTALRGKPIKSFNLSVRITGNGAATGTPVVIDSPMLLHYYIEARLAKTFDSGLTNHGLEGVGTIDQVELDIDATDGAAALDIWSDIPGGVLADRISLAIAPTQGRQILRFVLASPIDGRLFRHMITSTFDFQLYGFKVRVLPIGVYADGAQSDFWFTEPLAPGVQ